MKIATFPPLNLQIEIRAFLDARGCKDNAENFTFYKILNSHLEKFHTRKDTHIIINKINEKQNVLSSVMFRA